MIEIKHTTNNHNQNFKGRKIAVAKPVVNGVMKKIEIYSINKEDRAFVRQIADSIDLEKLLPSQTGAKNFSIWKDIIDTAAASLGLYKKQSAYIAVHDRKPCGILVTNKNRKQGSVGLLATWPTGIETRVKKAGSTLFTAFLDIAKKKKLQKITLEPLLNGPTDSVGFYLGHGMSFSDPNTSLMSAQKHIIKDTFEVKKQELNYVTQKNQQKVKLKNILDIDISD